MLTFPVLLSFSLREDKAKGTRTNMNIDSSSLLFIWLLPLTSCGAMTTGQKPSLPTASDQLTTQEASALASAPPQAAATTNVHPAPPPQTFTPSVQTEAPSTFTARPQRNHSQPAENPTTGAAGVSTRPSTPATAHASTETSPTPSTDATTAAASTSASRSTDTAAVTTSPPTETTALGLTTTPPTQSTQNKPGVLPSPTTTTKDATKPQKKKAAPGKQASYESKHGVVVGWVVGGALVLMMLSFLLIYIKKRKLSEQQITTKNWAGPSPFIENGRDDGQDGPRSSNRISLSSFLPHRMSRRLSLLPEAEEELEDITPGSTFGDRQQEASSAQQGAGQEDPGREGGGGGGAASPDVKEEPVPAASPQADPPASPGLEAVGLTDPLPPNGVGGQRSGVTG